MRERMKRMSRTTGSMENDVEEVKEGKEKLNKEVEVWRSRMREIVRPSRSL